jgi:hypothetical protein
MVRLRTSRTLSTPGVGRGRGTRARLGLLAAVSLLAAAVSGAVGTGTATAAAPTYLPAPAPLLFLQGFDFTTCSLASSPANNPAVLIWQAKYLAQAKAYNPADPRVAGSGTLPPATAVPYSTCNGGTAESIYDTMAAQLGAAIANLKYNDSATGTLDTTQYISDPTPATNPTSYIGHAYTGPVNVLTESLGGLVGRRCLLDAAKYPTDARFTPCKRIANLVMIVPPSHGTMFTVEPPVATVPGPVSDQTKPQNGTEPFTCTSQSLKSYYVTQPSGCHMKTADVCTYSVAAFGANWSSACDATRPTSDVIQEETQGTGPLNVADETPFRPNSPVYKGITHYYVFYSYADEVVFLDGEQTPTSPTDFPPHSSMLANATNIKVPNMTHAGMNGYSMSSGSTSPLRIQGTPSLNSLNGQLYITNVTAPAQAAVNECASEVGTVTADVFYNTTFDGFLTTPVPAGNYSLDCGISTPSAQVN